VVFDKLAELNSIEVPASQVHDEIHYLMDEAKERFQKMTGQKTAPDYPHEMFEVQAKRRVQNSYLLMKIIEENQLKADPAAIRTLAEEMAASYENPDQVKDYYLNNREQYRHLENLALENMVVDFLMAKAKINVIEKPYDELMANNR
jgi:trigger factor